MSFYFVPIYSTAARNHSRVWLALDISISCPLSPFQCCQPSVKITESSAFSRVKFDTFVIRNLERKVENPP